MIIFGIHVTSTIIPQVIIKAVHRECSSCVGDQSAGRFQVEIALDLTSIAGLQDHVWVLGLFAE